MVEKDYLLRQIEKLGVILAGIRELAFSGAAAEVLALKAEIERRVEQTEESARSREKAAILARRVEDLVGEGGEPELRARIEALIRRIEH